MPKAATEGRLLDGFLLLAAGGSQNPADIVKANLASLNIVDIASEDLVYFHYLDELDASDNGLSYEKVLGELSTLPAVSDIRLCCNKISNLELTPGDCTRLISLDLSYNELHGDVFMHLCQLNRLKFLNLTSNCVSSIPPEDNIVGFTALEELILDSNDLVQFAQWRPLDSITTLQKLSLSGNRIRRLHDDNSDCADESDGYFPFLAELDISQNDIADIDGLRLLFSFKSLRSVRIDENPLVKQKNCPMHLENIKLLRAAPPEPWHLKGRMKRKPDIAPRKWAKIEYISSQMKKVHSKFEPNPLRRRTDILMDQDDEYYESFFLTGGGTLDLPDESAALLDLTDEELDRHFKERRERVNQVVCLAEERQTKTPDSYMRQIPFALSAETGQKREKLKAMKDETVAEKGRRGAANRSPNKRHPRIKPLYRPPPVEEKKEEIVVAEEPKQGPPEVPEAVKDEVREAMMALRQAMQESEKKNPWEK